jgi:YcaO-like protein with predicted kinase domain
MEMRLFGQVQTAAKTYLAGTHRGADPAATLARFAPLMPHLGITRLANVTGLDCIGLPVVVAVRPNSRGLATSQGKGADLASAKVSALMESTESWHAERIDRPLRQESYAALRGHAPVVDIELLVRRSPIAPRADLPLLWIEGWDLMSASPMWVPLETVSTNFVAEALTRNTFFQSTNGLASGNTLLEATTHALCEVIERDAVALWELRGDQTAKATQLDLATIDDPLCRRTLDLLARAGVQAAAWDVTSDIDVPAYACTLIDVSDRPRWRTMGAFSGYGCHPAPGVALLRAITEAVQSRLTMISGSRDDTFPRDYTKCSNPDDQRRMLEAIATPPPRRSFGERASLAGPTFEGDLEAILTRLRRVGLDRAVVVDLSREEIGVPVVKVVVPGLEGLVFASVYVPGARARAQAQMGRSS